MSSFAVTVERVTILPHPNADALELAQIGGENGYRAVVRKRQYNSDGSDLALYVPEQAVLPDALIEELGLTGRLAGSGKNRVKAVRLRGELSQGLVIRPRALENLDYETALSYGEDFSEFLDIHKFVPVVPANMAGIVKPTTEMLSWIDIESIKRYPDTFTPGEMVTATEKIHGTALIASLTVGSDEFFVTSKGQGEKNLSLVEEERNIYWRAARAYDLQDFARYVAYVESRHGGARRCSLHGEVYGAGVQDLAYGTAGKDGKPGFAIYDIQVERDNGHKVWLDQDQVRSLCGNREVPMVPEVYRGGYDFGILSTLAEGKETISGTEANIREGVVVRPLTERYSDVVGGRAIGKIVGSGYLLRKGETTEYQ